MVFCTFIMSSEVHVITLTHLKVCFPLKNCMKMTTSPNEEAAKDTDATVRQRKNAKRVRDRLVLPLLK